MRFIKTNSKHDAIRVFSKRVKGIRFLSLILIMLLIGCFTQFIASYLLSTVLQFMPEVAENYSNNMKAVLQFTPSIVLYVVFLAPALEELVFRGLILGLLSKIAPFIIANITQALAFAIYHGNIVQGVYAFILGLFIGCLLYITENIFCTMAFHIGINITGLFVDSLFPEGTSGIILILVAVISFVLVAFLVKLSIKTVEESDLKTADIEMQNTETEVVNEEK